MQATEVLENVCAQDFCHIIGCRENSGNLECGSLCAGLGRVVAYAPEQCSEYSVYLMVFRGHENEITELNMNIQNI